jgi:hypothetical protein
MTDDNSFGLSSIRDGVREKSAELSEDADVRSYDDRSREDSGPFKPFTFQQEDFDRTEPDKDDLRKYWRQFETTPFVRKSITSFSRQVMEPGYYIQARDIDEDTLTDLDHWLTNCAIIEGERGQDFRKLMKKAIVQQEVRGTAFIEKAPDGDEPDEVAGLKLINAETMEAVTRPGQSILLAPDDIDEYDSAPEAESGGAAAWLQDLGETETFFGTPVSGAKRGEERDVDSDFKIGFREDEIIKMARDADAGELFGTSRLEAVSDRIEGLRNKLSDNDDAIASKAYPLWLFLFGTEENPWDSDDIDDFMTAHEMENFHAGMKQGVRGDVSVETVSGEVAEIAESLNFDIEWIMSVMPVPKYMLGAFNEGSAVGQIGGIAQQQETQRQIKDTRRDIEDKFTPLIREIAMQNGVDEETAESIRLKVGSPGEPEPEVPQRENIIRYVPKDQRDPSSPNPETQSPGNDGIPSDMIDSDGLPMGVDEPDETESAPEDDESAGAQVWHIGRGMEELSISGDSRLSDAIYEAMIDTKRETFRKIENEFESAPTYAVSNFERVANNTLQKNLSRSKFRSKIRPVVGELIDDDSGTFTRSSNERFFVQDIENSTENAIEEMLRLARIQLRRGVQNGEDLDTILDRVEREYDPETLRSRAELIAHMEKKNIVETTKLQRFESDDSVIGVRVVNDNPSTPLTESLAGAKAYFDDGDIRDQLMEHTRDEFLRQGFDPLPTTPPYHFNDTTTLEAIRDD